MFPDDRIEEDMEELQVFIDRKIKSPISQEDAMEWLMSARDKIQENIDALQCDLDHK